MWEGGFCDCCLGIVPTANLIKKSAWLLHLIGGKALLTVRNRSEVVCVRSQRRYPHVGDGGAYSTQDYAIDAVQSVPQEVHFHVGVINLEYKKGMEG